MAKGSQSFSCAFIFISWSFYSIWHAWLWEKVTVQKHLNHKRVRSFDLTSVREAWDAHVIPVTVVFKGQETMPSSVHLNLYTRWQEGYYKLGDSVVLFVCVWFVPSASLAVSKHRSVCVRAVAQCWSCSKLVCSKK